MDQQECSSWLQKFALDVRQCLCLERDTNNLPMRPFTHNTGLLLKEKAPWTCCYLWFTRDSKRNLSLRSTGQEKLHYKLYSDVPSIFLYLAFSVRFISADYLAASAVFFSWLWTGWFSACHNRFTFYIFRHDFIILQCFASRHRHLDGAHRPC